MASWLRAPALESGAQGLGFTSNEKEVLSVAGGCNEISPKDFQ